MDAQQILKTHFGYDSFRPLQQDIVNTVLSHKDCLVLMPTGGGKSICFQVPALLLPGITVVISPLISLMKDQVDALKSNGIPAAFLNSSLTASEEAEITRACERNEIKLLYISPERALSSLHGFLNRLPIALIAIDEAHCVSGWGHDFRPEYKELYRIRQSHPKAVMMALTATADKLTRQDILQLIGLREPEIFISSFDRPNLSLTVRFGMTQKEKLREIESFVAARNSASGIVYCTSKKSTELVAEHLRNAGYKAAHYHAGMSSDHRSKVQEDFINDEIDIVCATIAFGMGIDKSNVRYVIHYNLPKSIENYYQEIGRAGRDGERSDTLLFFSIGDVITLREFAETSGQPEINAEKLTRMQEYAEARICRRKILLNYFGENLRDNCGNCDVCKNPPKHFDGTKISQMALSAVVRIQRTGHGCGTHLLIDVLRGAHNQDVMSRSLHEVKTYGAGKDYSYKEWAYYILQMIQVGLMEIDYANNNHLRVTPFGEMVLTSQFTVDLVKQLEEEVKPKRKKTRSVVSEPVEPDNFEKLKLVRRNIAMREGLPPYIVFNDATLHEMLDRMPLTQEELADVPGMSENKVRRFGKEILDALHQLSGVKPKAVKQQITFDEATSETKVTEWIAEMQKRQISLSHTHLARILMGTPIEQFEGREQQISCFGWLKDRTTYMKLSSQLKSHFEQANNEVKAEAKKLEEEIFSEPFRRNFTEMDARRMITAVAAIPLTEKSKEGMHATIVEKINQYPRHGQPWSKAEKDLLKEAMELTNDPSVLSTWFQRSEFSMRASVTSMVMNERMEVRT